MERKRCVINDDAGLAAEKFEVRDRACIGEMVRASAVSTRGPDTIRTIGPQYVASKLLVLVLSSSDMWMSSFRHVTDFNVEDLTATGSLLATCDGYALFWNKLRYLLCFHRTEVNTFNPPEVAPGAIVPYVSSKFDSFGPPVMSSCLAEEASPMYQQEPQSCTASEFAATLVRATEPHRHCRYQIIPTSQLGNS
ncbi:uncharacterized protein CC84DRAFT_1165188 [Paraphaeosphaeria sporulosa]|uniref:Uncharacterized protein n=1 Tax=Paraphaeosphaeria sporulosa TaxID=1460663 RepID=A0A177CB60_9PLEO|nr:uncharacterized protein CC84DRAFT_1165188 [Paraphaeosphaeria sporulosa]OAG04815.1 hypothetical protein CC84DRAFT_1165188 [Paraphaeosphaeria sporulosa]